MLQQEDYINIDHNHWKQKAWEPREKVGRQAWEAASQKYMM
jgi:hypothetical protein